MEELPSLTSRSQCDEKWPLCTQCKLGGFPCPGPSSAFKFVYDGRHTVSTPGREEVFETPSIETTQGTDPSSLWPGHKVMVPPEGVIKMTDGGACYSSFRLTHTRPSALPSKGCSACLKRRKTVKVTLSGAYDLSLT